VWANPGTPQIFEVPPIIWGTCKATNVKLDGYIHRVHANKSPLKIWENRERGRIHGLPNFLKYPLLSQEWVKLRTSNLADIFRGSVRTKVDKKLGENGSWAYTGTAQIFWVPPIISGTDKATNFKFVRYIDRVHANKVKLRTSTFVRTLLVSIGTEVYYKFLEK